MEEAELEGWRTGSEVARGAGAQGGDGLGRNRRKLLHGWERSRARVSWWLPDYVRENPQNCGPRTGAWE